MTPRGPAEVLQAVFGRAFLLELARGNMENAKVFAQAFLIEHARPRGLV
jgi:hypothetical protein